MSRSRQPPPETVQRLRELLDRQRQATVAEQAARDALHLAAYQACEIEGASLRAVGAALGVPHPTVQGWVNRGKQLRGKSP